MRTSCEGAGLIRCESSWRAHLLGDMCVTEQIVQEQELLSPHICYALAALGRSTLI